MGRASLPRFRRRALINAATIIDWLVNDQRIAPHVLSATNQDSTFLHEDFIYDEMRDIFICPAGKPLTTTDHVSADHALQVWLISLDSLTTRSVD